MVEAGFGRTNKPASPAFRRLGEPARPIRDFDTDAVREAIIASLGIAQRKKTETRLIEPDLLVTVTEHVFPIP